MSATEPSSTTPVEPRAPKIIRTLNRPIAYSLTAVAMFGALGLGLATFSVDYEFAAMLLRVTVEILLGVGVLWAVPVTVWAVRAQRRGRLPHPWRWTAPLAAVGLLTPPALLALLFPITPVFAVCLLWMAAAIIFIRFNTAADGREGEA